MKIIAYIIVGVLLSCAVASIISFIRGKKEDTDMWYLHVAYDNIFWLTGELKDNKPELYKKVSKQLDEVIDALVYVEKILQGDEKEVD